MQFDLVDGWNGLAAWVVEQLLEVLDSEVGDADVYENVSFKSRVGM